MYKKSWIQVAFNVLEINTDDISEDEILIFYRKIVEGHYQSNKIEIKTERKKRRDMLRRILFTRQIDGPESC